ncbi:hypothetical protein [Sphingobium sp.]|uniref:hypothetical protein n=1 Tax=Sphingobium sp. TaxID=1912891 RepID=UPI002D80D4EE|nr:hypothetical protein [Sphingobium sp.]
MKIYLLALMAVITVPTDAFGAERMGSQTTPSAQIEEAPSTSKLQLIKRFMRAIGLQDQLETGSFLGRYAMPGGPLWNAPSGEILTESLSGGFEVRFKALKSAYEKRRAVYQKAYEDHLNWEFTEIELQEIVTFLEAPVGQHYLDGRWRMEAYTNTNTEDMEAEIVKEAADSLPK